MANTLGHLVNRPRTTHDLDGTDLSVDSSWQVDGVDLSGLSLPANILTVKLRVAIKPSGANGYLLIRNSSTNDFNDILTRYPTPGIDYWLVQDIAMPSNYLLDYFRFSLTLLTVTVVGYYL